MRIRSAAAALLLLGSAAVLGSFLFGDPTRVETGHSGDDPASPDADSGTTLLAESRRRPTLEGAGGAGAAAEATGGAVGRLAGKVLDDASGAPIPWVHVVAFRGGGKSGFRLTRTDASGSFTLDRLESGSWWLLAWHALYVPPGLGELIAGGDNAAPPDVLTIEVPDTGGVLPDRVLRLKTGRRIRGRVIDEHGAPIVGAPIRIHRGTWYRKLKDRLGVSLTGWQKHVPVRSGADGRFEIACLPTAFGRIRLAAYQAGRACRWSTPIPTRPDLGPVDVTIALLSTASIAGTVHVPHAADVDDVEVMVYDWVLDGGWVFDSPDEASVEADGTYHLSGLPPTDVEVSADYRGPYLEGEEKMLAALQPGERRTGIDFTLPPRYVVSVRLLTPQRKPLSEALVLVRRPLPDVDPEDWEEEDDETDVDGCVEFAFSEPGPFQVLRATTKGDQVLRDRLRLPCEALEFVVEALPSTRIELRVLDPTGHPVPRFRARGWSVAGDAVLNQQRFTTYAGGRDGKAVLSGRGAPPFVIHVGEPRDAAGKELDLTEGRVQVSAATAEGIVEVRLGQAGLLRGTVLDRDGVCVRGVRLLLETRRRNQKTVTEIPIAADGSFEFAVPAIERGIHFVRVVAPPGHVPVQGDLVKRKEPPRHFVLIRAGTVAGRVAVPDAVKLARAELVNVYWEDRPADPPDMAVHEVLSIDASGRFQTHRVPLDRPLTIELNDHTLQAAGLRPPPPIEGVTAGTTDLEFRLEAGLSIRGRVSFAGDRPRDCSAYAIPHRGEEWYGYPSAKVAADGSFVLRGMQPGLHQVVLVGYVGRTKVIYDEQDVVAGRTVRFQVGELGSIGVRIEGKVQLLWALAYRAGTVDLAARTFVYEAAPDLDGLPRIGNYDVVLFDNDGWVACRGGVRVGETVTLPLVEGVVLRGRLEAEVDLSEVTLFARGAVGCFELELEEHGRFDEVVAPGRYDLVLVTSPGKRQIIARAVQAPQRDLQLTSR